MQSLASQFYAFLVTVLIGITIGVLFDVYRVILGTTHPRKTITNLADLLFWMVATIVVFALLLIGNWGEIRFYVIIGVFLGVFIYIKLFSRMVLKSILLMVAMVFKVFKMTQKGCNFTWRMINYPIVLIRNIIIIPVGYFGIIVSKTAVLTKRRASQIILKPIKAKTKTLTGYFKLAIRELFKK